MRKLAGVISWLVLLSAAACAAKPAVVQVPPAAPLVVAPLDAGAPAKADVPSVENGVCDLEGDVVCSTSGKVMLACWQTEDAGLRYSVAQTCRGENGCTMTPKKVHCDNSIATLGEVCREEDDFACTPDATTALRCHGGRFDMASLCGGPKACRITGDDASGRKVQCDDSISNLGDPCSAEEHFSCSADRTSILRCRHWQFVREEKCKRTEKCEIRSGLVGCY